MNKKLLISILIIVFILLAVTFYIGFVGWSLVHPAKRLVNCKFNVSFEEVSFRDSENEVTLKGMYFKSPENSTKTIVFAHGYGMSRYQYDEKTVNYVESYLENGFNIFIFDFRNSGESEGSLTSCGYYEVNDLIGAINYVKEQNNNETIIVNGVSMGASTSIITTSKDPRIEYLIADSPFYDLNAYLNENLPTWSHAPAIFNKPMIFFMQIFASIDINNISPIESIKQINPNTKILLIHSTSDTAIPNSNSIKLKKAYEESGGTNLEYWEVDKSAHGDIYKDYPLDYIKRTVDFLNN